MVDISRSTTGNVLPASISNDVWSKVSETSVVQSLARKIDVPGNGLTVPMISGHAEASWVAETDVKPISRPTLGSKNVQAYMIQVTVPFSNQFRRDNAALYGAIVDSLPGAIAKKFDQTVFGYAPAPGPNFDTLETSPESAIDPADPYDSYVDALALVGANDADISAWVLSPAGEISALRARNDGGDPLFTSGAAEGGAIGSILGRPVVRSKNVGDAATDTIGIAGDWAGSAVWGSVGSITYAETDSATLPDASVPGGLLHLFSRNMFAVRFEVELAFRVRDVKDFVRLTQATP
ncbi:phage major capsid protein [Actinoplanes sp. NPDC049668]|uniref:phage major capsid protein n=1 Tax=unclassified Actinoplanes TaxID=2626549 RepID=UPI0033A58B93